MPDMPPPAPDTNPRRPLAPWVILLLGGAAFAALPFLPELERNIKAAIQLVLGIAIVAALLVWFLLCRRFSTRSKAAGVALLAGIGIAGKLCLRVDGAVDGSGIPKLAWRWSPPIASATPALGNTLAASPQGSADPRLAQAADVPQFVGAERDGVARGVKLRRDWAPQPPRLLWRQPVGLGWSSFAVMQGRAFTQEQRGDEELVTCYDLFTGKLVWSHADRTRFAQWQGGDGPRATPTVSDGRVYSYGGTGILNCLDAATGQLLWSHHVLREQQRENIEWGMSASPLVVDDKVIVTGGNTPGPVLFAYHRESGDLVWKAGNDHASYASPIVATLAGRRMILSNNARALAGHAIDTGAVLFEHAWGTAKYPKASQPLVLPGDRVFVSAGYGMGCVMLHVADAAGSLRVEELWANNKMKTQFNSTHFSGDHIYGIDDGRLACLDPQDGSRPWKDGRYASGQSLLVGDLLLIQNENGTIHLAAAQPAAFAELASHPALEGKTWNHPVLAGRFLLVRNDHEAACFELPVE